MSGAHRVDGSGWFLVSLPLKTTIDDGFFCVLSLY